MSRVCDILGKRTRVGNRVSHSNIKTKRKFFPNLKVKSFFYPEKDSWINLKVSTHAMRIINKMGLHKAINRAMENGTASDRLISNIKDLNFVSKLNSSAK